MNRLAPSLLACAISAVSTPALATHFNMVIDPLTGQPTLFVSSGIVTNPAAAQNEGKSLPPPSQAVTIYPAQQLENMQKPDFKVINADDFAQTASPAIIAALIKNKNSIDQENQQFIQFPGTPTSPTPEDRTLQTKNPTDLEKVISNLDNLIGNITQKIIAQKQSDTSIDPVAGKTPDPALQTKTDMLLNALKAQEQRQGLLAGLKDKDKKQPDSMQPTAPADNGLVTAVLMQQISNNVMEQARPLQQALHDRLNNVPDSDTIDTSDSQALENYRQNVMNALNNLMQTAVNMGVQSALKSPDGSSPDIAPASPDKPNADLAQRMLEEKKQAEQRRQQQEQQKEERRQEIENTNSQIIAQIQEAARQLREQNEQELRKKQKAAQEQLLQQMTQEQRERFEKAKSELEQRQSPAQQSEGKNPGPAAPSSISVAETLRQSLEQLQNQNSQQTKPPADKEQSIAGKNPRSHADALKEAIAKLEAMLNKLDQHMGNKPGKNGVGDKNRQALTEQLANLYAGLLQQMGSPSVPPQNLIQNPTTLVSLTKELAAKTHEQNQESLRQLNESLQLAVSKAQDPWASYIYVARQQKTIEMPFGGMHDEVFAYYEGKVSGTVGKDMVNGTINLKFDMRPMGGEIEGSMNFHKQGSLTITQPYKDRNQFGGGLSGVAFGGQVNGELIDSHFYGDRAEQIGGRWKINVFNPITKESKTGGGKFAGGQAPLHVTH